MFFFWMTPNLDSGLSIATVRMNFGASPAMSGHWSPKCSATCFPPASSTTLASGRPHASHPCLFDLPEAIQH